MTGVTPHFDSFEPHALTSGGKDRHVFARKKIVKIG